MGNERGAFVFLLGVVAAIALIGANLAIGDERAVNASAPGASRHLVVSLGAPLDVSDAGLMLANKTELFDRAGLQVELRPQPSDADAIAAVAAARAEIGLVKAESFLKARADGIPVVSFAAGLVESPVTFYALSSSGIHNPFDLVGKRIGYAPGTESAIVYEAMLARLSIPRSRLTEVQAPPGAGALLDGAVDLAPLGEADELALSRRGVGYTTLKPAEFGVHKLGTVYFASEKAMGEDRDVFERFLKALISGWGRAYDDGPASAALIAGDLGLEPARVQVLMERQRPLLRPLAARFCEFEREQWRQTEDILVATQILAEPIDLSTAVDFGPLHEAYRRTGALAPGQRFE
jgi:ABC-type nitrate/sulfonate/bicarbonate transport system substrate-binding protein